MKVSDQSFLPIDGGIRHTHSRSYVDFSPPSRGVISMYSVIGDRAKRVYTDNNVCVNGSRKILANLLAYGRSETGDPLANFVVDHCIFGHRTNGQDVLVTTALPLPSSENTDIDAPALSEFRTTISGEGFKVAEVVTLESGVSYVTFQITMLETEGVFAPDNVGNYSEMGLFSADGTMYAHKTFPSFIKTTEGKLVVFWTILL